MAVRLNERNVRYDQLHRDRSRDRVQCMTVPVDPTPRLLIDVHNVELKHSMFDLTFHFDDDIVVVRSQLQRSFGGDIELCDEAQWLHQMHLFTRLNRNRKKIRRDDLAVPQLFTYPGSMRRHRRWFSEPGRTGVIVVPDLDFANADLPARLPMLLGVLFVRGQRKSMMELRVCPKYRLSILVDAGDY